MKTILMSRDYSVRINNQTFVQYCGGVEYKRVPEVQARAIIVAKAGKVIKDVAE